MGSAGPGVIAAESAAAVLKKPQVSAEQKSGVESELTALVYKIYNEGRPLQQQARTCAAAVIICCAASIGRCDEKSAAVRSGVEKAGRNAIQSVV